MVLRSLIVVIVAVGTFVWTFLVGNCVFDECYCTGDWDCESYWVVIEMRYLSGERGCV